MNIRDIIIVGIALAMDAVGVAISIGVNPKVKRYNKVAFVMSFSIFQFLFFLLGGIGGHLFEKYITTIPNIVGGLAIAIVGILMIKEGLEEKEEKQTLLLKKSMVLILGISVSIDAFVVGFTGFNYISNFFMMIRDCSIVGFITFILCICAFYLCKYIKKIEFISKYADFLGGITLIIFSIKMIFF